MITVVRKAGKKPDILDYGAAILLAVFVFVFMTIIIIPLCIAMAIKAAIRGTTKSKTSEGE